MRRSTALLLLVAATVLCLAWIVHESYDEMSLFSALPADTTVVTYHEDLGERADLIATNPLTRAVLMAASGNKPRGLFSFRKAPTDLKGKLQELLGLGKRDVTAIEEILMVYAPERTAVGIVPGADGEPPAVVLATYLGSKMHTLKTLAGFGFEHPDLIRDTRVYQWNDTIHLAFDDGLLFGCFASTPQTSRAAMQRVVDGRVGQASNLAQHQVARMDALIQAGVPDAGVWSVQGIGDMRVRLTELSRTHLGAEIVIPQAPSHPASIDAISRDLGLLYGNHALAITIFQPGHGTKVFDALPGIDIPDWILNLQQAASLAVLGGEFSGSFLGLPSAVMTVELDTAEEGLALLERVMAEAGDHVTQGFVTTNERKYVEFETALNKGAGPLAYKDKISCHLTDQRLYLGSSTTVLDAVLNRLDTEVAAFEADHGRWLRELRAEPAGSVTGFGWVDTDALCGKVSMALSAAGVAFLRDKQKKEMVERARTVVDGLKEMKRLSIVETISDDSLVFHVRSGP